MYRTTSILLFFLLLFWQKQANSQCHVTVSAFPDTVVCGDAVVLNVSGVSDSGLVVFSENFNSGAPTGWAFTQQAMFNNPCSPGGVDGTTHIWMGNNSPVPRSMVTLPYDLTPAVAGATICFDLLMATQTGNSGGPCEGPDEPDEGVYLQYSTDGGNTWNTIHYFDPNGGTDPQLINWNHWCFQIPAAAITGNTQIRWFQDNDSGADFDHWGIDNVLIFFNDPTYNITITNTGYQYGQGSSGGPSPPIPMDTTTTFDIIMTNSTGDTCTGSITVPVVKPNLIVNAGNDTTICLGNCAQINATAKVIKRPAKTPKYSNGEFIPIATGLGATSPININVTGLNMPTVLPGSITSVCITSLNFFGFNLFPPGQQTIGDLEIYLICPDGTRIKLIPTGVTTSADPTQGYVNTCFTPTATTNIATASANYTGNYIPGEPLDNLVGCTANGVWSLEVVSTSAASFGVGLFSGWSITFNDPEISYTADLNWNPTTSLSNSSILNPLACPTDDIVYTITASDTAGCVTVSDDVAISVDSNCCHIELSAAIVQPMCNMSDGSVDLTVTVGSGSYTYNWSNGATTEDLANVPAGTYFVTVTDLTQGCDQDTLIILSSANGPTIDSLVVANETCMGDSNGMAAVYASGGTGSLSTTWSNLETTNAITGLAPGTYTVTVEDATGCQVYDVANIAAGGPCCNLQSSFTKVDASCAGNDGSITISVLPGTGYPPFEYSIDGVNYQTPNTFSNLSGGVYNAIVRDSRLCLDTNVVAISQPPNTLSLTISSTDITCFGDNDGTASASVNGGTSPYAYSWSNSDTSSAISNLTPGTYILTVSDAGNCNRTDSVTINDHPEIIVDLGSDLEFCDMDSISLDAGNGFARYQWSTQDTTQMIWVTNSDVYAVTVYDQNNCTGADTVSVDLFGSPAVRIMPGDTTIPVSSSLPLFADVTGAANSTGFSWTPADFLSCTNCQSPVTTPESDITYVVTYMDSNGCSATDSIVIKTEVTENYALVPKAFTPNNDGNNDFITIFAEKSRVLRYEFHIFNRWGQQVYYTDDLNMLATVPGERKGWDGTYKGEPQSLGVFTYFAKVEFLDGEKTKLEGSITLIR